MGQCRCDVTSLSKGFFASADPRRYSLLLRRHDSGLVQVLNVLVDVEVDSTAAANLLARIGYIIAEVRARSRRSHHLILLIVPLSAIITFLFAGG